MICTQIQICPDAVCTNAQHAPLLGQVVDPSDESFLSGYISPQEKLWTAQHFIQKRSGPMVAAVGCCNPASGRVEFERCCIKGWTFPGGYSSHWTQTAILAAFQGRKSVSWSRATFACFSQTWTPLGSICSWTWKLWLFFKLHSGHICSMWPFQRQKAARRIVERRGLPTRELLDSYVICPRGPSKLQPKANRSHQGSNIGSIL